MNLLDDLIHVSEAHVRLWYALTSRLKEEAPREEGLFFGSKILLQLQVHDMLWSLAPKVKILCTRNDEQTHEHRLASCLFTSTAARGRSEATFVVFEKLTWWTGSRQL